jgi:hypothetical protein
MIPPPQFIARASDGAFGSLRRPSGRVLLNLTRSCHARLEARQSCEPRARRCPRTAPMSPVPSRANWRRRTRARHNRPVPHLGAQLVLRTSRRVVITEAGKTLYESAKQLVDDFDAVESAVGDRHQSPRPVRRCLAGLASHRRLCGCCPRKSAPVKSRYCSRICNQSRCL